MKPIPSSSSAEMNQIFKENQLLKKQNIMRKKPFITVNSNGKGQNNSSQQQKSSVSGQNSIIKKQYADHIKQQKQKLQSDQTEQYLRQSLTKLRFSKQNLNFFYQKSQSFKASKQKLQFQHINEQLRSTQQKLKNKNFKPNPKYFDSSMYSVQQELQLAQKLTLIEKIVDEDQFQQFKRLIDQKMAFLSKKYKKNEPLKQKIINYYTSYQVLERFLKQIIKESQKLSIKQQNLQLYYQIKQSMISVLIDQEYFLSQIKNIQELEQRRQKICLIKNLKNQQKYTLRSGTCTKLTRFFSSSMDAEKDLCQRIQQLLQISKNNIKQAFINFNKPHLMYEMELQFHKRLSSLNKNLMVS